MKPDKFTPKTVSRNPAVGPGTKGVLPFYKAVSNSKAKAAEIRDVFEGCVFVHLDADGRRLGVEIR